MLDIVVNGTPQRIARASSIADLVRSLDLDPARVAVERNRVIVPRSTLAEAAVADGDRIEIVEFVGGG